MCGIAGIVGYEGSPDLIDGMTDALAHRGPDDRGIWTSKGVMLGHRRLSILDLSDNGHQPMVVGHLAIVYNGELYNFRQLRDHLCGPFTSECDTEVVLHLYARYGARCVEHMRGMFAFAIWDGERQRLFAARDRVGIKPLFYCKLGEGFAFASELKSLLHVVSPTIDRAALRDFFTYKYVPAPKTIYEGVSKLLMRAHLEGRVPPGTLERAKAGFTSPVRRWCKRQPELLRSALNRLSATGITQPFRRGRLTNEQIWSLLFLDRWIERNNISI